METSSHFHYSPYLLDSASETKTWVATVGNVVSYGISSTSDEVEIQLPFELVDDEASPETPIPWLGQAARIPEIELTLG
ncbi:MAG: hypothetical protein NTY35_16760 [Planctomycetota bacterium]|nr:hypothetical protein [Planctomycetota bacterium]